MVGSKCSTARPLVYKGLMTEEEREMTNLWVDTEAREIIKTEVQNKEDVVQGVRNDLGRSQNEGGLLLDYMFGEGAGWSLERWNM
jgi:hypothetical protein